MSSGFADDLNTGAATMRGRDWPCLRQFCVFMENRVGRLHEMFRQVERHDLRIIGLSVVDSVDFAVARVILDSSDRGRELFQLAGLTVTETDVIGVELPATPQPFVSIFTALVSAELNIHYTYPLLHRRNGRGAIVLHVDDVDQATQILSTAGFRLITEGDLLDDDEYL
jgi:hypothetical protein